MTRLFGLLGQPHRFHLKRRFYAVISLCDLTQHAELRLVQRSLRKLERSELSIATLYTSTEPCVMCSGAIYWAGISKVVFGCPADALAKFASGSLVIPCSTVFEQGKRPTEVVGPVLQKNAEIVHQKFW